MPGLLNYKMLCLELCFHHISKLTYIINMLTTHYSISFYFLNVSIVYYLVHSKICPESIANSLIMYY